MGSLDVAGLSVIDRLVVTAHRAGCSPILLMGMDRPRLERTDALGIPVTPVPDWPSEFREPVLSIDGSVVLEARDLENVMTQSGRLVRADGTSLPVRMTVQDPKPVLAGSVATLVQDKSSAAEAEGKLWASLASPLDGLVDRLINRPLGRPLSKLLVHTRISPNQVSLASILIGLASAWFFLRGYFVVGALVFQLSAIIDCVDGDLARALHKQSRLGKWLDLGGDQVVHVAVFAALGVGVFRSDPSVPAVALGGSAVVGVLLCFAVILRSLRQPVSHRSPLANKLLDAAANRDFSILLLALAIFDQMDLFLWMAGIGIHVFWITLLALNSGRAAPALSREAA